MTGFPGVGRIGGSRSTAGVISGAGGEDVSGSRGEEHAMEGVETVAGGDGHSAGGDTPAEARMWRISSNCGLSVGSRLQQSSIMSQTGSGINVHCGRSGLCSMMPRLLIRL